MELYIIIIARVQQLNIGTIHSFDVCDHFFLNYNCKNTETHKHTKTHKHKKNTNTQSHNVCGEKHLRLLRFTPTPRAIHNNRSRIALVAVNVFTVRVESSINLQVFDSCIAALMHASDSSAEFNSHTTCKQKDSQVACTRQ